MLLEFDIATLQDHRLLFKLPVGFVEDCSGTKEPSAILSRPSVAHPLRPHGYRRPDGSREVNAIGKPADLDELQVAQKSLPCQVAITYPSSSYTPKEVLIERIIPEYPFLCPRAAENEKAQKANFLGFGILVRGTGFEPVTPAV